MRDRLFGVFFLVMLSAAALYFLARAAGHVLLWWLGPLDGLGGLEDEEEDEHPGF